MGTPVVRMRVPQRMVIIARAQGLDDDDEDEKRNKVKRNSGLRDKLKGRQKSEAAQLEVELEDLEKEILSLDSGSFQAEIQTQEDAWQKLRQVCMLPISCMQACGRAGVRACGRTGVRAYMRAGGGDVFAQGLCAAN